MRRTPFALAALACAAAAAAGDRAPVAFTVVDGAEIPAPLTAAPGDPVRGVAIATDPERADAREVSRDFVAREAVGARLTPGALRLAVVNYAIRDPEVDKPAYYDLGGEAGADAPLATRLSAQEIEDVVAWLATLRD